MPQALALRDANSAIRKMNQQSDINQRNFPKGGSLDSKVANVTQHVLKVVMEGFLGESLSFGRYKAA